MEDRFKMRLKMGHRGLLRGSSLDKLLAKHGIQRKRRFTPEQVLEWADAFFAVHRHWPYLNSGPISDHLAEAEAVARNVRTESRTVRRANGTKCVQTRGRKRKNPR
jgi:hypothetical protein